MRYFVEAIRVEGLEATRPEVVLRRLRIRVGDTILPDDPRVDVDRIVLLGTGLFREVTFQLRRGSRPGRVVLVVHVRERGTILVRSLYLGYSEAVPFWGGFDLAEENFLGRGLHLSAGFVVGAAAKDIGGARLQHAEQLRFAYPELILGRVGLSILLLHNQASDYFRLRGWTSEGSDLENFAALVYQRAGGRLRADATIGHLNHIWVSYRLEWIRAHLPVAAVRRYPDGREERIRFDLRSGDSWLSTLGAMFVRDTRNDPVTPSRGMRLLVAGEMGTSYLGSDYTFFKLHTSFAKYWSLPWRRHVIALHLFVGAVVGETPLYNKFFVGDLTPLVPSRSLGLNFSTRPTRNFLSNSIENKRYESLAGRAAVSYRIPLSRGGRIVYRSDLYLSMGIITLLSERDFRIRDQDLRTAVPLDLTVDVGVRLDTYVGVFTLSLGNSLGWLPR